MNVITQNVCRYSNFKMDGGLFVAVDPGHADALFSELGEIVPTAQKAGTIEEYAGGKYIFLK